ncbi:MAG: flagellar basal body P-ring protein FlgI [Alphaproteobacteria bacterium]|nr:flagellar basal body P-ring protein FlgI [Alphaproteobacteria bacterium]MCL2505516.1 flagellar basal body P-ring protein FlgI [Alphaproteobacteria bacterium]
MKLLKTRNIACSIILAVSLVMGSFYPVDAKAASRIKDIVSFEGVRDNVLVGYGLVVGLNGTGDSLTNVPFTARSLVSMLERLGVNTTADLSTMKTKNVAAVMVTATLPPFSAQGSKVDVVVSAMGDAKSLQGGTLLVTTLQGADGEIYALAQGTVVSGVTASGQSGSSITKGVPTSGRISSGAIVEREVDFNLSALSSTKLSLRNPDFTTAKRIAEAINTYEKAVIAYPLDSGTVIVSLDYNKRSDIVGFMNSIEQLTVVPDDIARVIIDEAAGVIVMGEDVRISTVAVAQGNLTIKISETQEVSQPEPFSRGGNTEVITHSDISIDDSSESRMTVLKSGVSLQTLVENLNALGVSPRDMMQILQSIKAAGALQADLEVI